MDLLRAQTKNLPAIVKDPLVEVLGPKCFKTLVDELDVSDVGCLKFAVSKALSLGMVAGGGILKVLFTWGCTERDALADIASLTQIPQIVTIVQAKSARGLSLSSYLLDTASLVFFNTYNLRLGFPLVSYGENLGE